MGLARAAVSLLIISLLGLAGCATRPVNPPLKQIDPSATYPVERQGQSAAQSRNLVILAFSGGGTRAAAFSYGVLEQLKRTELELPNGQTARLLDQIDVITGVSGGIPSCCLYWSRVFR